MNDHVGRKIMLTSQHGAIVGVLRQDWKGLHIRFPGGSMDVPRALENGWRYAVVG